MVTLLVNKAVGDVVKLDGVAYRVVSPLSSGVKVLKEEIYNGEVPRRFYTDNPTNIFTPDSIGNIAHYLNNEFYNSLSVKVQSMIINAQWDISTQRSGTTPIWINAKVGMLSLNEWIEISPYFQSTSKFPLNHYTFWLINPGAQSHQVQVAYGYGSGNTQGSSGYGNLGMPEVARPVLVLKSTLMVDDEGNVYDNQSPSTSLSSPPNNQTFYENDSLTITGVVRDEDANQSVTVYYQINSGTRRVLATDVSQKNIALSKQFTFKGGKLYDGQTAVTGALTDGVAHKLKVWAVDDQGGTSTIVERTFYVVPNRAPSLTVNPPVITGNIDTDKLSLSGAYADPDNNTCTVSYKVNGGNSVQVASGVSGNWSFEITFGQLKEGQNTIVIENIDSYGAKTSKTVKLNKTAIETPLLKSVARYKLTPPLNEATGVLLYVQRSEGLIIDVKISMTLAGEPESFVPMTIENTAPVPNEVGIVEDELYYIAAESKQNIIVQIEMERSSVDVSDKIIVIEGAFY